MGRWEGEGWGFEWEPQMVGMDADGRVRVGRVRGWEFEGEPQIVGMDADGRVRGWEGEVEVVEERSLPSWRSAATAEPVPIRTVWDVLWPITLPVARQ